MSKRKYLSEFAVGMGHSFVSWIPASEINAKKEIPSDMKNILDNCHIYAISKAPQLSFNIETFQYKDGIVSGEIVYKVNGEMKSFSFKEDMPLHDGATTVIISDYPYREIITINDNNEKIRFFPANLFTYSKKLHTNIQDLNGLEILYIGQAYGDGKLAALDRLKSHSTLQKILAEVQKSSPDDEVNVLVFKYEPYEIITQMDGRSKAEISDYRDIDRFYNIFDNPLTEYQQICLIEAGLIRYFQPKYNKIYKESFPSEKHKILEECYALDFSALMVSIEASQLGFSLYSEERKLQYEHICNIELTDPKERFGFFHFGNGDGTTTKIPNVITR